MRVQTRPRRNRTHIRWSCQKYSVVIRRHADRVLAHVLTLVKGVEDFIVRRISRKAHFRRNMLSRESDVRSEFRDRRARRQKASAKDCQHEALDSRDPRIFHNHILHERTAVRASRPEGANLPASSPYGRNDGSQAASWPRRL